MLPLVFVELRLRRTSVGDSTMLPSTGVPLETELVMGNEGERRCLCRYEVDETERGSAGRCEVLGDKAACVST
jgi:hypothetical protein